MFSGSTALVIKACVHACVQGRESHFWRMRAAWEALRFLVKVLLADTPACRYMLFNYDAFDRTIIRHGRSILSMVGRISSAVQHRQKCKLQLKHAALAHAALARAALTCAC